jgi:hypothetical protein
MLYLCWVCCIIASMSEKLSYRRTAGAALSLSLLLSACSRDHGSEVEPLEATTTITYMLPEPKPTTTTRPVAPVESVSSGVRDVADVPFSPQHCLKFSDATLFVGDSQAIKDPTGVVSYSIENIGLTERTNSLTVVVTHEDKVNTTKRHIYDDGFGVKNFAYDDGSSAHVSVRQNPADIDAVDVGGWTCI